jgi:site-specific recombinase XerD
MTAADSAFDPDEHTFNLVTKPTKDALDALTPKAAREYRAFKSDYLDWLAAMGKNPHRRRGYADTTLEQISIKTDQIFRWLWDTEGRYTLQFAPEDADALMSEYARYDYTDANLLTFVKVIKRYFKYLRFEKGRDYEWKCDVKLSEKQRTERDYLRRDEFAPLYNAALDHGSVRHYNQVTPEERDRIKAHLAQRFEKPKKNITPADFERANSYKVASLVGVTLDVGLRPIEVTRAVVTWVNQRDNTLDIPGDEATKSDNDWKCRLSDRSMRALGRWLDERKQYEKYAGSDALWLNRRGNPYESRTLNYLLNQLIEDSSIEPTGRDLTWYSLRHGVATAWANEEGLQHAREQLRHEKVETTMRYVHSSADERGEMANSLW